MTKFRPGLSEAVLGVSDGVPTLRPRLFYRDGQVIRGYRPDGEAFREEQFWNYVGVRSQVRKQYNNGDNQFNANSDRHIADKLTKMPSWSRLQVRIGDLLIIAGNGLVATGQEEDHLSPNIVGPDRILMGRLGGMACGPYYRAAAEQIEQIFKFMPQVDEFEEAMAILTPPDPNAVGALAVLYGAVICHSSEPGQVQESAEVACVPIAEPDLHFYHAKDI